MILYSKIISKNIIQFGGNFLFFFLVLVIMLDPTNTVLHLKDVFFVLLVGYNIVFFKPDFRYLFHIGVIYFVIALCFIIAEIQGSLIVYDEVIAVCKSFSPLVLLLWIRHYNPNGKSAELGVIDAPGNLEIVMLSPSVCAAEKQALAIVSNIRIISKKNCIFYLFQLET